MMDVVLSSGYTTDAVFDLINENARVAICGQVLN